MILCNPKSLSADLLPIVPHLVFVLLIVPNYSILHLLLLNCSLFFSVLIQDLLFLLLFNKVLSASLPLYLEVVCKVNDDSAFHCPSH